MAGHEHDMSMADLTFQGFPVHHTARQDTSIQSPLMYATPIHGAPMQDTLVYTTSAHNMSTYGQSMYGSSVSSASTNSTPVVRMASTPMSTPPKDNPTVSGQPASIIPASSIPVPGIPVFSQPVLHEPVPSEQGWRAFLGAQQFDDVWGTLFTSEEARYGHIEQDYQQKQQEALDRQMHVEQSYEFWQSDTGHQLRLLLPGITRKVQKVANAARAIERTRASKRPGEERWKNFMVENEASRKTSMFEHLQFCSDDKVTVNTHMVDLYAVKNITDTRYYAGHKPGDFIFQYKPWRTDPVIGARIEELQRKDREAMSEEQRVMADEMAGSFEIPPLANFKNLRFVMQVPRLVEHDRCRFQQLLRPLFRIIFSVVEYPYKVHQRLIHFHRVMTLTNQPITVNDFEILYEACLGRYQHNDTREQFQTDSLINSVVVGECAWLIQNLRERDCRFNDYARTVINTVTLVSGMDISSLANGHHVRLGLLAWTEIYTGRTNNILIFAEEEFQLTEADRFKNVC